MGFILKRLWGHLAPYKGWFFAGQLAMLLATAAGLAFPWAVRTVFDTLFSGEQVQMLALGWAVAALALVSVIREAANAAKNYSLGFIGQKMIRDLRSRVYERLLQLSLDYYDRTNSGDISSSLTNDMNIVQQGLSSGLTTILQQAISLVAVIILLVSIDPVLALSVFITLPIIILISRKMGDRIRSIAHSTQERLGYLLNIVNESVSGIAVIQSFVLESHALGLFRDENNRILSRSLRQIKVQTGAGLVIGLLNAAFLLIVIGLGAYRVAGGALAPADLIAFILYAEMITGPISVLAGLYLEINRMVASYQRISNILETPSDLASGSALLPAKQVQGKVEFRGVTFGYDAHKSILQDINLSVAPGQTIALVGPSGAGKSTLAKLLPRFYDPMHGAILLDGVDIRSLDLQALRTQIAIVPQDTHLFGMSIHDNIACGKVDASEEEIRQAARLANAHDFILEQEHGYDTEIGERGARLSGGQRQRLAIARAFLKDPRILILDEATSALDTQAERQVQHALDSLMRGRTTFIIAHRLSTIENADQIVVFKDGRILAVGTHSELLETCMFYHDLYRHQFSST